jgi:hypothetical protein
MKDFDNKEETMFFVVHFLFCDPIKEYDTFSEALDELWQAVRHYTRTNSNINWPALERGSRIECHKPNVGVVNMNFAEARDLGTTLGLIRRGNIILDKSAKTNVQVARHVNSVLNKAACRKCLAVLNSLDESLCSVDIELELSEKPELRSDLVETLNQVVMLKETISKLEKNA